MAFFNLMKPQSNQIKQIKWIQNEKQKTSGIVIKITMLRKLVVELGDVELARNTRIDNTLSKMAFFNLMKPQSNQIKQIKWIQNEKQKTSSIVIKITMLRKLVVELGDVELARNTRIDNTLSSNQLNKTFIIAKMHDKKALIYDSEES